MWDAAVWSVLGDMWGGGDDASLRFLGLEDASGSALPYSFVPPNTQGWPWAKTAAVVEMCQY